MDCFAHLSNLERTASGQFKLAECLDGKLLEPTLMDKETLAEVSSASCK